MYELPPALYKVRGWTGKLALVHADLKGSAWFVDDVSLCAMDAAGHSFRVLDSHVHIYPPAWLDNATLLYGGNSHNGVCASFLCKVVPVGGGGPSFYNAKSGAVSYIDMPNVSNGALFYRTLSAGIANYRMADLNLVTGNVINPYPSFASPPFHTTLTVTRTFDYYAVRPGGRDVIIGDQGASFYYSLTYINGVGTWNILSNAGIPDQVNDPAWNGTPESGSYVYTQRNTFIWVP